MDGQREFIPRCYRNRNANLCVNPKRRCSWACIRRSAFAFRQDRIRHDKGSRHIVHCHTDPTGRSASLNITTCGFRSASRTGRTGLVSGSLAVSAKPSTFWPSRVSTAAISCAGSYSVEAISTPKPASRAWACNPATEAAKTGLVRLGTITPTVRASGAGGCAPARKVDTPAH